MSDIFEKAVYPIFIFQYEVKVSIDYEVNHFHDEKLCFYIQDTTLLQ